MIISRYIARELYKSTVAITGVLLAILIVNQFVLYVNHIVSGQFSMLLVMRIMAIQIPMLLGYLVPLALYLSVLMVLGRFYLDQEMIVLQACGYRPIDLIKDVLKFSGLVLIFVSVLMFWVEPQVEGMKYDILYEMQEQGAVSQVLPQEFLPIGKDRIFYASTVSRNHQALGNVFLAQKQSLPGGHVQWTVTTARHADQNSEVAWVSPHLVFRDVNQLIYNSASQEFHSGAFAEYGIRFLLGGEKEASGWPKDLGLIDLWKQRADRMVAAEFQWRLSMPIAVILLSILAIPLSYSNPRLGRYLSLFPAIALYLIYYEGLLLNRGWIRSGAIDLSLGVWWVHAFLLVCILVIYGYRYQWGAFVKSTYHRMSNA